MRSRRPRRWERGSVILELPLIFGLLLIPFGMLVVSAPVWVERQTAARDAAAEVSRYLLINGAAGSRTIDELLREIEAGYGLASGTLRAELPANTYAPGEEVTVAVTVEIPAVSLPILGGIGAVDWTATHSERSPDFGATR